MANDHFVTRFQTAPWEVGQRRLHYFDFEKEEFGERSSESLLARPDLHSEQTGQLLSRIIETPLSQFLSRTLRAGITLIAPQQWSVFRAVVGLTCLQVQRTADALNPIGAQTLDGVLVRGEKSIDDLARAFTETHTIVAITLPSHEQLFFPEIGYFAIPMIGQPPVFGYPMTPRHLFILSERDFDEVQIKQWMNVPGMMSAFSVGISLQTKRVLLPPSRISYRDANPAEFGVALLDIRAHAFGMFQLIGSANYTVGLRTWMPNGPPP